jgi:hypothetical protein
MVQAIRRLQRAVAELRGNTIASYMFPRTVVPTNPRHYQIYLDDGTNTASGAAGWRQYDGSSWVDLTSGGSGSDPTAIHDNVASEISAITEKTTPVGADMMLLEDSEDSNNKKMCQWTNLPKGLSHVNLGSFGTDDHTEYLLADGSRALTGALDLGASVKHLKLPAQAAEPGAPVTGDVYLDDGTNTESGGPALRYYDGAAWNDLSVGADFYLRVDGTNAMDAPIDFGTTAKLFNVAEQSAAPGSPATGDIYLDDGTNTNSGIPCLRHYNGAAWEDLTSFDYSALSQIVSIDATNDDFAIWDNDAAIYKTANINLIQAALVPIPDSYALVKGSTDGTKQMYIETDTNVSAGQIRILKMADAHIDLTPDTGTFASTAKGVTNGDTHDHSGGDGAQIDHGGLAGLADWDHTIHPKVYIGGSLQSSPMICVNIVAMGGASSKVVTLPHTYTGTATYAAFATSQHTAGSIYVTRVQKNSSSQITIYTSANLTGNVAWMTIGY